MLPSSLAEMAYGGLAVATSTSLFGAGLPPDRRHLKNHQLLIFSFFRVPHIAWLMVIATMSINKVN